MTREEIFKKGVTVNLWVVCMFAYVSENVFATEIVFYHLVYEHVICFTRGNTGITYKARRVMVSKLDWQIFTCEFEFHWMPYIFDLLPKHYKAY